MSQIPGVTVVCVGEGLVVFVPDSAGSLAHARTFTRSLAGAELNTAIALAHAEISSGVITRLGDDGFGHFIVDELQRHGVATDAVAYDDQAATGLYIKELAVNGRGVDSRMHYYRAASAGSRLSHADIETPSAIRMLQSARAVHTSGVTTALSSTARELQLHLFDRDNPAVSREVIRSFSVHWRAALWHGREQEGHEALATLARRADLVLVSEEEMREVFELNDPLALRSELREPHYLLVSHRGGTTAFFGDDRADAPMVEHRFIESIGGSDAIAAGFLAGVLSGLSPAGSLARANRLASRVMASTHDHLE
ncbi:sugar kinase [Microbacterium sp. YY-01]|uniref:sugar kinase n=1 Tax=Microbacterium sp. YY-01 TaxID=3421634 RepID=UPI003D163209